METKHFLMVWAGTKRSDMARILKTCSCGENLSLTPASQEINTRELRQDGASHNNIKFKPYHFYVPDDES